MLELRQRVRPDGAAPFPAPAERGARTAAGEFALTGRLLFCTGKPGCANCVSVFAPNGRLLFCTDPAGHSNCRRRVRPFRAGSFPLNLSGGIRRRCGGNVPRPAAGAKRKDNLRFSFLFELLPFPWIVWRRFPICDRFENRERQSGYCSVTFSAFSQFTDSVLLHRWVHLSRRDITVSRNSLTRYTAWHLRIRRLVQFIFVGAIYHNALTICAALLCRALRRVNRMCSRTVSGTANMSG